MRLYSAGHMADHPGQIVRRLIVSIGWDEYSKQNMVGVEVLLRGKRQIWRAGGPCKPDGDRWICQPDTDGDPQVLVERDPGGLKFSNPTRFKVFDDVTGPGLNEARVEGAANRVFVLAPTTPERCSR